VTVCPHCHQQIAVERFGVRMTPLKAGIIDLVIAAGDDGISSRDILASDLYRDRRPHSGVWSPLGIKAHVQQINEVIAEKGVRIVSDQRRWFLQQRRRQGRKAA
jgi:hypothetical protein